MNFKMTLSLRIYVYCVEFDLKNALNIKMSL